ncbi:MAG: hypothetical protein Q7R91_01085 [bacterium]|nr:hypothetical protein [bacterium]
MHEALNENNNPYRQYKELGGIINKGDYESALARAQHSPTPPKDALIEQVKLMAEFAGIELHNTEDVIDQRTILYGILRTEAKPKAVTHHHSQMSDQRLFAEALRMSGDTDALSKLVNTYHKAGTYCPICSKVVASGEECR